MPHPFETRNEIEVPATPEEVWDAIATGQGMDAWFMGRNTVEPGVGGRVRTRLPGVDFEGTITAWEPLTRFAERSEEGEDGSVHAFEYLIEGRGQGSTVVRWVHSGFLGDDWEAEYDALREGDPMYFDKLAKHLTYFRGRIATPVNVFGPQVKDREHAWEVFRAGLGLAGPVSLEERVRLTPEGPPVLEGVVDWLSPSFLGVRTDDGLYRFMHSFDTSVGLGHHVFVEGLDQQETEQAWGSWLTRLFS
ncbi:MAG: SRPBCC domain-containing protein [Actinobacteria bacterium]|nr:SRPBCC domain-containing protein [Actinomycetota bacterium]